MLTPLAVRATVPGSYGALELKQDYRRHMLAAVLIAAALHLCIVGGILLYQASLPVPVEPEGPIIYIDGSAESIPLPPIVHSTPQFDYSQPLAELTAGIPVPCPDAEVYENPHIPTKTELAQYNDAVANASQISDDATVIIKSPVVEGWPEPTEILVDGILPVLIHSEEPVYPEMAALTGQSGTVWIQALVDAEGRVRQANVLKSSGSNVGFDEAAVKAAFANVYKPAIQNGRPVPVWISYRVDFKLR